MADPVADGKEGEAVERDETGLLPKDKATPESQVRRSYFKMMSGVLAFWAPLIAVGLSWLSTFVLPGQSAVVEAKISYIREQELGYLYAAWMVVYLAR